MTGIRLLASASLEPACAPSDLSNDGEMYRARGSVLEHRTVNWTKHTRRQQRRCHKANERQARWGESKRYGGNNGTDRAAQKEHGPTIVPFVVCVRVDAFVKIGRSRQGQRPN